MEHKEHIETLIENKTKHYFIKGFKVFLVITAALALAVLFGYIVMWLWNWLMPKLFGLPPVSYWQAIGILILAKILFGFGGASKAGKGHASKNKVKKSDPCRRDFSKWEHYDQFWKEEGEKAYQNYVDRAQNTEAENK